MKVLFCHDGPLRRDENNNYYGSAHNDDTFSRYYAIADELKVLIRVKFIESNEAEKKLSKITVSPFEVIEVPNVSSISGQLTQKRKASELINNAVNNSDYIIIRMPSIIGEMALKAAIKSKKKYAVELVACSWDSLWNHSFKGKLIAPFQYVLTKNRILNSENVIYITKEFLQSRYPTKWNSYICPNVSLKNIDYNIIFNNRIRLLQNFKSGRKIIIGSIGSIDIKYKGHSDMIKALRILVDQGYDFEYQIAGGGNSHYLNKIIKKYNLENRVKLLGSLSHQEIFSFLDKVDIYVQPSLAEAQGRSLIEAMSRGCLCICTNVGGMPELMEEQYIADKGNAKSLAKRVKDLVNSDIFSVSERNISTSLPFQSDNIEEKRMEILKSIFVERGDSL